MGHGRRGESQGALPLLQVCVPHMIARKEGKIVNIGSIDGREGVPGFVHYCPSKAGVHMLTDTLAKELASYNINVNCVAPGAVWTRCSRISSDASSLSQVWSRPTETPANSSIYLAGR